MVRPPLTSLLTLTASVRAIKASENLATDRSAITEDLSQDLQDLQELQDLVDDRSMNADFWLVAHAPNIDRFPRREVVNEPPVLPNFMARQRG